MLEAQPEAHFEKRQDRKVYTGPGEDTWKYSRAQVLTNEKVTVYGTENGWVLVSYPIGGSGGRIGYITDDLLADRETVQPLRLSRISMQLLTDASPTDDPLHRKTAITKLKKGDPVTLLAWLGDSWAYVQFTLDGSECRAFVPRKAVMPAE